MDSHRRLVSSEASRPFLLGDFAPRAKSVLGTMQNLLLSASPPDVRKGFAFP
jgi:hypothetical protein